MRIAIVGYGKMGKRIEQLALEMGHSITHRIDADNVEQLQSLDHTDVAIEFSTPEVAVSNYKQLFAQNIPVVTGTTGWYAKFDEVCHLAKAASVPFMYATNFSIGVQLALAANEYLAGLMTRHSDYLCRLEEWHHTAKKDAPSGTAITFAEGILDKHGHYDNWELQVENALQDKVLPIQAYRQNDIPGTHRVTYQSPIDQIVLEHKAYNRDGFANGAIAAAAWLLNQRAGVYTMKDLLRL